MKFWYVAVACCGLLIPCVAISEEPTMTGNGSAEAGQNEFVPPSDGYDWLQLTSGEWLKGELIAMYDETVEFDSEILDELAIDAEDIRRFVSPRTFGISVRSAGLINGQVRVEQNELFVTSGVDQHVFELDDLVAITVAADRERDRWSADMMFGFNAREGNTRFLETNITAAAERRTPISRVQMDYRANYNRTEGTQVADNHRVNLRVDRFSRRQVFWRPLISQFYRDPFQNIANQISVETGLGYELIDTKRTAWEIYTAVGVNYVERDSSGVGESNERTSPSISFGTDFDTELTSWIDYEFNFRMTFLDEESGKYQHNLVTSVSTDLIGDIDFDVSLVWDRTENPQASATGVVPEKDDFRVMVGIGYDF